MHIPFSDDGLLLSLYLRLRILLEKIRNKAVPVPSVPGILNYTSKHYSLCEQVSGVESLAAEETMKTERE